MIALQCWNPTTLTLAPGDGEGLTCAVSMFQEPHASKSLTAVTDEGMGTEDTEGESDVSEERMDTSDPNVSQVFPF